ncbi:citrate synthase [Caldilinea sp.]|uniref:citrate synthase n=1 Tax=Caldilinea sp. TaxID=2293560 RepID=UPI002B88C041|nr:citrate synthase [Anaerolineales bacterium]HQY95051.1 citrate synthase [Caldilinea sp.]HRA68550.1 citrate synthase [Caldilinea sp.]
MTTNPNNGFVSGLEGVVAAQTRLSHVDGQRGELILAGYALEEVAPTLSFEAMVHLLWHDRLPTSVEVIHLHSELARWRALPPALLDLLQSAARTNRPAMDALRMAAGAIDLDLPASALDDGTLGHVLLARIPTVVAAYWRLQQGAAPIAPDPALGHAANYLYMLTGSVPNAARVRGLETYLNTVIDHGLNASTFTARVIIATHSDLVSAITGAIGALKGPLHGGAPGPALDMVFAIGEAARAEAYLRAKLEAGERLMGFGHRIYKVRDPRAEVLAAAARDLYAADGDMALYTLAGAVEETAVRLLAEFKPGRNLQTNVEFYTALLLHGLALPTDLFAPTFAVGRVAGWIGHAWEQIATGRLIRPASQYIGARGRSYEHADADRSHALS